MSRSRLPAVPVRRGIAIPLVLVLVAVASVGIFVFQMTVQHEAHGTHKLVRTLHAEAICDRVVSRLAAVIGQKTWENRFYLLLAISQAPGAAQLPEAKYVFDQDRFPFGDEGPEFASGDAAFTGSVKDVSALEQRYRVTVKARYQGVAVLGVYDLTHAQGTMGPLNRTAVDLRVMKIEEAPAQAEIDAEMDAIPVEARKPENVLGPGIPVPDIPAIFPPASAPPPASPVEQVAGLVGGKLVPAFNPPAAIVPNSPQAQAVNEATTRSTASAGTRAGSDFTKAKSGALPPGSVLQPGNPVPPPRRPGVSPPATNPASSDPNADPFASDPGSFGNDTGTYNAGLSDPSLGAPADDGTGSEMGTEGGAPAGGGGAATEGDGSTQEGTASEGGGDQGSGTSEDGTEAGSKDGEATGDGDETGEGETGTEGTGEEGTGETGMEGTGEEGAGEAGMEGTGEEGAGETGNEGSGGGSGPVDDGGGGGSFDNGGGGGGSDE